MRTEDIVQLYMGVAPVGGQCIAILHAPLKLEVLQKQNTKAGELRLATVEPDSGHEWRRALSQARRAKGAAERGISVKSRLRNDRA